MNSEAVQAPAGVHTRAVVVLARVDMYSDAKQTGCPVHSLSVVCIPRAIENKGAADSYSTSAVPHVVRAAQVLSEVTVAANT